VFEAATDATRTRCPHDFILSVAFRIRVVTQCEEETARRPTFLILVTAGCLRNASGRAGVGKVHLYRLPASQTVSPRCGGRLARRGERGVRPRTETADTDGVSVLPTRPPPLDSDSSPISPCSAGCGGDCAQGEVGDGMADPRRCPTESACKTASSHHTSPPASRARRDVAVHDGHASAHVPHPNTAEHEERVSPEQTLPLKTSKYFARASTRSVLEDFPVLTPLGSPMLSIPIYIESSDFEYPPLDVSFDEPVEGAVNEPRHIPTWYNSPSLFDDLMIMLRRLKPILVQGAWCRLHYCFSHE
jgi:hypothetical protein